MGWPMGSSVTTEGWVTAAVSRPVTRMPPRKRTA